MKLARDPGEIYRRVDFDARVVGANSAQLVDLCFEQVIGALDRAIHADGRGDFAARRTALGRAAAALTALVMGVDPDNPTGPALLHLYESARNTVVGAMSQFDAAQLAPIRADFIEIRAALFGGG